MKSVSKTTTVNPSRSTYSFILMMFKPVQGLILQRNCSKETIAQTQETSRLRPSPRAESVLKNEF